MSVFAGYDVHVFAGYDVQLRLRACKSTVSYVSALQMARLRACKSTVSNVSAFQMARLLRLQETQVVHYGCSLSASQHDGVV